jgi:hypothetical protein
VRLEGLGQLKKFNGLIGNRTRDFLLDDELIGPKHVVEETTITYNIVAYNQSTVTTRSCTTKTAPVNCITNYFVENTIN